MIESPKMYSAPGALAPYRISLRSSRMISTCRSDTAEKISISGRSMGGLPSRCIDKTSVPALCASTWSRTPIISMMSIAGLKRSTACPPDLRGAGERSMTVTSNP
ncbi:Uncharacterised protein [Mycobacteroides abscessus subsp. abscessus]|nr:Uncharacterised protein [Mycobacteroides abscessus subsp. abscessus]